jgi:hypothetical protein
MQNNNKFSQTKVINKLLFLGDSECIFAYYGDIAGQWLACEPASMMENG